VRPGAIAHKLYGDPNLHPLVRSTGVEYLCGWYLSRQCDHSSSGRFITFSIRIEELNELFAPLTVVESVVSQEELSVFSLGHIGETHYVLTSVS